ncbi:glycosyltransferase family 2 protein [Halocola ammonii]
MPLELSIVICTYNRSDFLPAALESLAGQTLSKDRYEVIVINNNSTDQTEEVSKAFEQTHQEVNFGYYIEKNQGLSFARNRGIKESKGKFISYIDDDAVASPSYAEAIVEAFGNFPDYAALGGKVTPFYDGEEPKWLTPHLWGMVAKVDQGEEPKTFGKKTPVGCNMAFRKEIFKTIGLFDTERTKNRWDDRYIFNQVSAHGYKTLYYPKASVRHHIPSSRVSEEGIVSLARANGKEYRKLVKGKPLKAIEKFFDYLFKVFASFILSLGYLIKGEPAKTKVIKIMFFSFWGYFTGR